MPDKNITLKNANVVTPDGVVSKGIIDVENGRIKQRNGAKNPIH